MMAMVCPSATFPSAPTDMWDTRKHWVRGLYLYLTAGTSSSVEWAWLVARVAVVSITAAATYASYSGFGGAGAPIFLAIAAVCPYTALLGYLLKRGFVRAVFLIGFVIDNMLVAVAWWSSAGQVRPVSSENDLWLILLPLVIVGVARTGPKLGLGYVGLLIGWLALTTVQLEVDNSYAMSQLPVRIMFLGIVGALTTWLVSELNLERDAAQELQAEAETLSEISHIIGSSLNVTSVFTRYSPLARKLIPYEMLVLAELDEERTVLRVLNVNASEGQDVTSSTVFALPSNDAAIDLLTKRNPFVASQPETIHLLDLRGREGEQLLPGGKSAVIAPVISGDGVVGALIALSRIPRVFNSEHLRTIGRISELVGNSMTNLRVFGQDIQLANEREARLTLNAANRQLQQDNEARSFFLSAVSHELRTPLTSIIAFNGLLLRNRDNNLSAREMQQLELIKRNSEHLATLVNDLLDLSYIDSGKVSLSPENFAPVAVLKQLVASVTPMLNLKRQELVWQGDMADMSIIADRQRFSQIAANLLSNASKYSPGGSRITLTSSVSNSMFEIAVHDEGEGISEEEQAHLFQPFFRGREHRSEKIPGTGLGLVIVKSLLDAHGGGIDFCSPCPDTGYGTVVRVWFPVNGSGINSYIANSKQEKSA